MRYESLRPRFEPFLLSVEKPGRYLGLERNVTRKPLPEVALSVCLAFPDAYEIGMSHTGTDGRQRSIALRISARRWLR